jgi:hypothetical protein
LGVSPHTDRTPAAAAAAAAPRRRDGVPRLVAALSREVRRGRGARRASGAAVLFRTRWATARLPTLGPHQLVVLAHDLGTCAGGDEVGGGQRGPPPAGRPDTEGCTSRGAPPERPRSFGMCVMLCCQRMSCRLIGTSIAPCASHRVARDSSPSRRGAKTSGRIVLPTPICDTCAERGTGGSGCRWICGPPRERRGCSTERRFGCSGSPRA